MRLIVCFCRGAGSQVRDTLAGRRGLVGRDGPQWALVQLHLRLSSLTLSNSLDQEGKSLAGRLGSSLMVGDHGSGTDVAKPFQILWCSLGALRLRNQVLAAALCAEHAGRLGVTPLLLEEGVALLLHRDRAGGQRPGAQFGRALAL